VLENFLQKVTDKTWKSLSFGIVSTTLMQSSSLVSVITISFLSAGFIALTRGKLIREQKITSDMATSLMNNTSYAYDIERNPVSAAEIIFASVFSREKDLCLSDEEIDKLMVSRREEAQIDAFTGQDERNGARDQSV